jgi:hypothetical protein
VVKTKRLKKTRRLPKDMTREQELLEQINRKLDHLLLRQEEMKYPHHEEYLETHQ